MLVYQIFYKKNDQLLVGNMSPEIDNFMTFRHFHFSVSISIVYPFVTSNLTALTFLYTTPCLYFTYEQILYICIYAAMYFYEMKLYTNETV